MAFRSLVSWLISVLLISKKTSRTGLRTNAESVLRMYVKVLLRSKYFIYAIIQAADAAVSTSDEFATSMHWATYRASESE